ncbi:MAG: single-stranded DNA-binding protein [Solirubrobacterales bacterium]|nr:single-stranded DNA-binding protein [Solirubrobacterales bacterium]
MNINRIVLTGNLTADPELRPLPSGTSVGRLRLAVNTRRKNSQIAQWAACASALRVVKLRGHLWAGIDG